MVSTSVLLGSLCIVGLFVLGVWQSTQNELPRTALAGAVSAGPTQEELNACMRGCMRACVTQEGLEQSCLHDCNVKCGAP